MIFQAWFLLFTAMVIGIASGAPARAPRALVELPDVSLLNDNDVLSNNGNNNSVGDVLNGELRALRQRK